MSWFKLKCPINFQYCVICEFQVVGGGLFKMYSVHARFEKQYEGYNMNIKWYTIGYNNIETKWWKSTWNYIIKVEKESYEI